MPELPEVETVKIQLTQVLPGQTIESAEVVASKSFQGDPNLLRGKKVEKLDRKGKILIFHLSRKLALAVHLKMTGQLLYFSPKMSHNTKIRKPPLQSLPDKYTRVILKFKSGTQLFFNDLRKFGWMKLADLPTLTSITEKLGPDPLTQLDNKLFHNILKSSKRPVKLILMDQEKIAGIGNIYANEALFLSKIHPKTASFRISPINSAILLNNLKKVLIAGVKFKGSSRTHFRDIYGQKGSMQEHFLVYNRENTPCPNNCGSRIKRIKLAGRSSFFCPRCQKML